MKTTKKFSVTLLNVLGISVIAITALLFIMISSIYVDGQEKKINDLTIQVEELSQYRDKLMDIGDNIDSRQQELDNIISEIETKKAELEIITSQIESEQSRLNDVSEQTSLLDSYDYVLYDLVGNRNDMTLELVQLGVEKCNEKNINPDLLFGIIMVESQGYASVTNSSSGAAGLGQFMPTTGKYIANTYLNIDYDHSTTPYDSSTNISMIVEYLAYLSEKYNGDIISMIKEYSGGDLNFAYSYYAKVCSVVGKESLI